MLIRCLCFFGLMYAHAALAAGVLVLGDSLSAGYGIRPEQSWPALLAQKLAAQTPPVPVVNASVSGETSAGGMSRLDAAMNRARPQVLIIALGANDGLRGLPPAALQANLKAMVRAAKRASTRVLLIGMKLPPNLGATYNRAFERAYQEVAKTEKVALLPFLLAPIALDADAFQADGLHPTAAAQAKILNHVWPALQPLLKSASSPSTL